MLKTPSRPDIDLRCSVVRQFLAQIYAFIGIQFTGLKMQWCTNMRHGAGSLFGTSIASRIVSLLYVTNIKLKTFNDLHLRISSHHLLDHHKPTWQEQLQAFEIWYLLRALAEYPRLSRMHKPAHNSDHDFKALATVQLSWSIVSSNSNEPLGEVCIIWTPKTKINQDIKAAPIKLCYTNPTPKE